MIDVIAALRFLIESGVDAAAAPGVDGAFNVCAPNPVTNAQFFKTLGQVVHRPSSLPTPGFALRLVAGELADGLLLNGQRQVPTALEGLGFKFKFAELEPALRDLMK
jgi:NAD dependent epimerase/dehydratase family enzyme